MLRPPCRHSAVGSTHADLDRAARAVARDVAVDSHRSRHANSRSLRSLVLGQDRRRIDGFKLGVGDAVVMMLYERRSWRRLLLFITAATAPTRTTRIGRNSGPIPATSMKSPITSTTIAGQNMRPVTTLPCAPDSTAECRRTLNERSLRRGARHHHHDRARPHPRRRPPPHGRLESRVDRRACRERA
jgi:hypothetical protein